MSLLAIWTEGRPPPALRARLWAWLRVWLRRALLWTPALSAATAASIGLGVVASQQTADQPPPVIRDTPLPTAVRPVLIDINTATAAELATLPGLGPSRAEAIIQLRARQPFRSLADLVERRILRPAEVIAIAGAATVYAPAD